MNQTSTQLKNMPAWADIVSHADDGGPVLTPDTLVEMFDALSDPNAGIMLEVMAEARKHSFLPPPCRDGIIDMESQCRIQGLSRWVFQEISHCNEKTSFSHIMSCVFIAAYLGRDVFWASLPRCDNTYFFQQIAEIVQHIHVRFMIPENTPSYEKDLYNQLKNAMDARDYISLNSCLPPFERNFYPSPVLKSCILALAYHQWDAFKRIVDNFSGNDLFTVINSIEVLPANLCHKLMQETENPDVVYLLSSLFRQEIRMEDADKRHCYLTDMFKRASEIPSIWDALNKSYLCHLNLSPEEQTAFGTVMASVPQDIMDIWLDNLSVKALTFPNKWNHVTCGHARQFFERFEQLAEKSTKKYFFRRLYEIYQEFKRSGEQYGIPYCSNIDYGLYQYYRLYTSNEERRLILKNILLNIETIDNRWYPSSTKYMKSFTQYMSEYQIIYRSIYIDEDDYEDSLNSFFVPSFLEGQFYRSRFRHALPETNIIYVSH